MGSQINQGGSHYSSLIVTNGGSVHQGNNINIYQTANRCLSDLRVTDPRLDKKRIEETKGGLLTASYEWVLENPDFCRWRDGTEDHLLWVKGDPGKGKTMLLCGIIDQLETNAVRRRQLSYFFCQATDAGINNASAVLRGLMYMLLERNNSLESHIKEHYDRSGEALFQDRNAWQALSEIFMNILEKSMLGGFYLIVDALDECVANQTQLLDLIMRTSKVTGVKWLISSRNWPQIEEKLRSVDHRISLELNAQSVSAAVDRYIAHKISELVESKGFEQETQDAVRRYLSSNANGTFLWVSLVCEELGQAFEWEVMEILESSPPGLEALYERMISQVERSRYARLCLTVLALVATAYRPLSLAECITCTDTCDGKLTVPRILQDIISLCGSFLTIRGETVYFVHQSAKDYLIEKQSYVLFPRGQNIVHNQIATKSAEAMSQRLKRDMYHLCSPGFHIQDISPPVPDPLAGIAYSCIHWVSHLAEVVASQTEDNHNLDDGLVDRFMKTKFLYWVEALSLLKSISEGILALERLIGHLPKQSRAFDTHALVCDGHRVLRSFRPAIENWPLQVYTSPLIFSPPQSLIRNLFRHEEPPGIEFKTSIAENWSPCIATLEEHLEAVASVAFSVDGRRIVSASEDKTVKIWDNATGACVTTLEGHEDGVSSISLSADGRRIISASWDKTVRIWDAASGKCLATLKEHTDIVSSVSLSADDRQIVSASWDKTIRIWDVSICQCVAVLRGHEGWVSSAAFSADGRRIVSASFDMTVRIWDTTMRTCIMIIKGHKDIVLSAVFSADGRHVVSASQDRTIRIWDASRGSCLKVLVGHTSFVSSATFSADGRRIISAGDTTIKTWDTSIGTCTATLQGHRDVVLSAMFSADGQTAISASEDGTIKIWDTATNVFTGMLEGHKDDILSVSISTDGRRVVSVSKDKTVKIWDTATGACITTLGSNVNMLTSATISSDGQLIATAASENIVKVFNTQSGSLIATLEGHTALVHSISFSADERQIVSASSDTTVKVWDVSNGICTSILEGHERAVHSACFSEDGRRVLSGSGDRVIKVWDISSGLCISSLEDPDSMTPTASLSADGRHVVFGTSDGSVKAWDVVSGACKAMLGFHMSGIQSTSFSIDGRRIVSGARDGDVKIWDTTSRMCLVTLEAEGYSVDAVSFSADGQRIILAMVDRTVRIWDISQGIYVAMLKHDDPLRRRNIGSFSKDGQCVASVSEDNTVKIWDMATSAVSSTFQSYGSRPSGAKISMNGRRVAVRSCDYTVVIWDTSTGVRRATLYGHEGQVLSTSFSADNRYVVSTSSDKSIRTWNIATGKCIAILKGHEADVTSASFSSDGCHVISASKDKTLKIWDISTGTCLLTLEGNVGSACSAAFSLDGQRVVSASIDGIVKIWDAAFGTCLATYKCDRGLKYASFNYSGTLIHTNIGDIRVDSHSNTHSNRDAETPALWQDRYSISPDGKWILGRSRPMLWLPPDYRPMCSASKPSEGGMDLVLGCSSGQVYIVHFSKLW